MWCPICRCCLSTGRAFTLQKHFDVELLVSELRWNVSLNILRFKILKVSA